MTPDSNPTMHTANFRVGVGLFVLGFACPLFIPLVTASALSTQWKTIISGLLGLGIPELLWVVAAAVMGKEGFNHLKGVVFGFLKRQALPATVGPIRYRIGLIMLLVPILLGWVQPYAAVLVEELTAFRLAVGIGGDVLLLVSLFVLGGEFWGKLQALFVHA